MNFSIYVIEGVRKSGKIVLNGLTDRQAQCGDIIIIISYAHMDFEEAKRSKPQIIFPDKQTNLLKLFFEKTHPKISENWAPDHNRFVHGFWDFISLLQKKRSMKYLS